MDAGSIIRGARAAQDAASEMDQALEVFHDAYPNVTFQELPDHSGFKGSLAGGYTLEVKRLSRSVWMGLLEYDDKVFYTTSPLSTDAAVLKALKNITRMMRGLTEANPGV